MTGERTLAPREGGERATLTGFLDFQRATLAVKCDGLTGDQLRQRAVPPSKLSLLGLVRHMAEVERVWFRPVNAASLDVTGMRGGSRFSLRWVLTHMIEEYARHNGHADLLRERIDGATGQ